MKKIFLMLMIVWAVCASAQETTENRGFKAVLNGKIAVEVFFQTAYCNGEWQTAGYIYYPKAKTPAPILIVANWGNEKPIVSAEEYEFDCRFEEYQPDGETTGILYLTYTEVEGDFQMLKGSWKNPTTGKVMKLSQFQEMRQLPNWWPGSPAVFGAPKRDAWKFLYKLENKYDESGDSEWMDNIRVIFEVDGKEHPLSFEEPLNGAVSSDMEESLTWIFENDINFDGIPDLLVYLGVTHHAQSVYKAFVWNPVTRQFYNVKAFEEIQEPDFDSEAKTITSRVRDVDKLYIETYRWKNGKLTLTDSSKINLYE